MNFSHRGLSSCFTAAIYMILKIYPHLSSSDLLNNGLFGHFEKYKDTLSKNRSEWLQVASQVVAFL